MEKIAKWRIKKGDTVLAACAVEQYRPVGCAGYPAYDR